MEHFSVPGEGHALPAVFYTSHWILRGVLYQRTPMRLSDHMNMLDDDLLTLHQVQVTDLVSGETDLPSPEPWLVARGEILMLHEGTMGEEATASRGGGDRVVKRPVAVRCYVGPFRVEGQYYMADFANMAACLNRPTESFVPLTAVRITIPTRPDMAPILNPFALVNRTRLVITGEGQTIAPVGG